MSGDRDGLEDVTQNSCCEFYMHDCFAFQGIHLGNGFILTVAHGFKDVAELAVCDIVFPFTAAEFAARERLAFGVRLKKWDGPLETRPDLAILKLGHQASQYSGADPSTSTVDDEEDKRTKKLPCLRGIITPIKEIKEGKQVHVVRQGSCVATEKVLEVGPGFLSISGASKMGDCGGAVFFDGQLCGVIYQESDCDTTFAVHPSCFLQASVSLNMHVTAIDGMTNGKLAHLNQIHDLGHGTTLEKQKSLVQFLEGKGWYLIGNLALASRYLGDGTHNIAQFADIVSSKRIAYRNWAHVLKEQPFWKLDIELYVNETCSFSYNGREKSEAPTLEVCVPYLLPCDKNFRQPFKKKLKDRNFLFCLAHVHTAPPASGSTLAQATAINFRHAWLDTSPIGEQNFVHSQEQGGQQANSSGHRRSNVVSYCADGGPSDALKGVDTEAVHKVLADVINVCNQEQFRTKADVCRWFGQIQGYGALKVKCGDWLCGFRP